MAMWLAQTPRGLGVLLRRPKSQTEEYPQEHQHLLHFTPWSLNPTGPKPSSLLFPTGSCSYCQSMKSLLLSSPCKKTPLPTHNVSFAVSNIQAANYTPLSTFSVSSVPALFAVPGPRGNPHCLSAARRWWSPEHFFP